MKPVSGLVFIVILLVTACSSAPSANAVQTAIAETQAAQPVKQKEVASPTVSRPDNTIVPTVLPKPTATYVPTNASILKLTPTPITGWNKFEASGIEIWLPESYEGGDLENDTEVVIDRMKALGPEFEQIASTLEKNPSMVKLIAVDTNNRNTGFVTNINIGKEQILSAVTLDMYMETMKQQLPSFWEIIDQKKLQLDQYDTFRLVSRLDYSGTVMKQLQYLIKDHNTLWIITCTTVLEEFDERLPIFEQIVGTFKIQP